MTQVRDAFLLDAGDGRWRTPAACGIALLFGLPCFSLSLTYAILKDIKRIG